MSPLNHAFLKFVLRADRQDDAVLERTFVEFGSAVSVLNSVDHQIIFGRRGTGKTHLLTHIRQSRRAAGEMAIQLDLRTIGSNNGIYGDSATSIVQRGTRLLLEVLGAIHGAIFEQVVDHDAADLSATGPLLDQLADVIKDVRVVGTTTVEATTLEEAGGTAQAKVQATLSLKAPSLGAEATAGQTTKSAASTKFVQQGTEVARVSFGNVGAAFRKLVATLPKGRLWLLIDEWSEIPLDLQPYLADLLRRAVLPTPGISVKLAAIEQRSRFLVPNSVTGNLGLELGADVAAAVTLDEYMVFDNDAQQSVAFFKKLVLRHVQDVMTQEGEAPPTDEAQLISMGFTQANAFEEIVRAAEGVPRDAMYLLTYAAQRAKGEAISVSDARGAALRHYQGSKDPNVSANDQAKQLLTWIIDKVIKERQTKAFLLEAGLKDKLIDYLYDERVLHVLRKGMSAQDTPGVRYHVYGIDYGCYVDLINTKGAPKGLLDLGQGTQDFSDEVPKTDFRSIRRCVLDLEDFYKRDDPDQGELKLVARP